MNKDNKVSEVSRSLESGKQNSLGFFEGTLRCWAKDGGIYFPDLDLSLSKSTSMVQDVPLTGKKSNGSKSKKSKIHLESDATPIDPAIDGTDDLPKGVMKTRTVNGSKKPNGRKVTTLLLSNKDFRDADDKLMEEDEQDQQHAQKKSISKAKPQEETRIKEVDCKVWSKEELEAYHKWQDKNCISLTTEEQCKQLLETFKSQDYCIPIYYKGKNWVSQDAKEVIHQYAILSMKNQKISVSFRINNQPYNNATSAIRHINDLAGTKENEKIQGYLLFKVYVNKKFVLLQEIIPWEFRSKGRFSIESTRNKRTLEGNIKKKPGVLDLGDPEETSSSAFSSSPEAQKSDDDGEEQEDLTAQPEDKTTCINPVSTIDKVQKTVCSKSMEDSDLDTMFFGETVS